MLTLCLLHQQAQEAQHLSTNSIENGTIDIIGYPRADFTKFIIEEAFLENEVFHNLESMFISYIKDQKLVQLLFWAKEEDYIDTYDMFEIIFNSAQVKI